MTHNALFADMTKLWEQQQGVPDAERGPDRNRPVTFYGNDDIIAALDLLAAHKGASVSAVIEDMIAERYERLTTAGVVQKARVAVVRR